MKLLKNLAITLATTVVCCTLWVLFTWLAPPPFGYGEPSLPQLPTAIPKYEGPTEKPTFAYPLIEVGDHVRVRSEAQRFDAQLTVRNGYMLGSFLVDVETKSGIEKRLDPWTLRRHVWPPPGPSPVGSSRVMPMWGDAQLVLGEVVEHPDAPAKSLKEVKALVSAVLQKTQQNKFLRSDGLLIATNRPIDDAALQTVIETARSHGVVDFEFLVESGSEPAVLRYSDAPDPCTYGRVVDCKYRPICVVRAEPGESFTEFFQRTETFREAKLSARLAYAESDIPECDSYEPPEPSDFVPPQCDTSDPYCVGSLGRLVELPRETLEADCADQNPLACAALAWVQGKTQCEDVEAPTLDACLAGEAAHCWAMSLELAKQREPPSLEGQVIEWNIFSLTLKCTPQTPARCIEEAQLHLARHECAVANAFAACRYDSRYCPWFVRFLWSVAGFKP